MKIGIGKTNSEMITKIPMRKKGDQELELENLNFFPWLVGDSKELITELRKTESDKKSKSNRRANDDFTPLSPRSCKIVLRLPRLSALFRHFSAGNRENDGVTNWEQDLDMDR